MATRTVQEQVEDLFNRRVVEERSRGVPSPDVEAAALFESIAISLLLNPRASLYIAHLARNALLVVAQQELSTLTDLEEAIADLGNTSLAIRDTQSLQRAKNALLAMEGQGSVKSEGPSFQRFSSAIDSFLDKQLSKNVRRPGSSHLTRPSAEASQDLFVAYGALQTIHDDLLDRLYALSVGIENFLTTPLGVVLGLGTASRVRTDIQEIVDSLEADPSATISRDAAIRLLTNRAALRVLGAPPDVAQPVLSSALNLPVGYGDLLGASGSAAPSAASSAGPWAFPENADLGVQVGSDVLHVSLFPQTSIDQKNAAVLVGTEIAFPLSFEPGESLFLMLSVQVAKNATFEVQTDGTYTSTDPILGADWAAKDGLFSKTVRVNFNEGASTASLSIADVLFTLDTQLGSLGSAFEYILPGTDRIYIWTDPEYIGGVSVSSLQMARSASTIGTASIFSLSGHAKLGLFLGQTGLEGTTGRLQVQEAFDLLFSSLASLVRNADGTVTVTSEEDAPTTLLTLSGLAATAMGLAGAYGAGSAVVRLSGSVLGVQQDPLSPLGLVDVGDLLTSSTGQSRIRTVSSEQLVLEDALDSFSGSIEVESALYLAWKSLDAGLQAFIDDWLTGPFASNLARLDAAIAPLSGAATPALRNAALAVVAQLRTSIDELVATLSTAASFLPAGSGLREKRIVDQMAQALVERKYDRAVDLLLRCRIQEFFELDWQSASFAGSVLQAASNIARTDLQFPNRALGEGTDIKAFRDRFGTSS